MKGKIVTRPLTALNNKLCIEYHWFEKDHTDSDHLTEDYEIFKHQWNEIIERNLVGKEVEFKKVYTDPKNEDMVLAQVIISGPTYREEEVQRLVTMAWRDGFYAESPNSRSVARNTAEYFWEQNKKK